jgi:hypothetical protein
VYTKEGTRVPSLNTGGFVFVYWIKKTGGRRKIFITRANFWQVDLAAAQHLFSPFVRPFSGVKFLYD